MGIAKFGPMAGGILEGMKANRRVRIEDEKLAARRRREAGVAEDRRTAAYDRNVQRERNAAGDLRAEERHDAYMGEQGRKATEQQAKDAQEQIINEVFKWGGGEFLQAIDQGKTLEEALALAQVKAGPLGMTLKNPKMYKNGDFSIMTTDKDGETRILTLPKALLAIMVGRLYGKDAQRAVNIRQKEERRTKASALKEAASASKQDAQKLYDNLTRDYNNAERQANILNIIDPSPEEKARYQTALRLVDKLKKQLDVAAKAKGIDRTVEEVPVAAPAETTAPGTPPGELTPGELTQLNEVAKPSYLDSAKGIIDSMRSGKPVDLMEQVPQEEATQSVLEGAAQAPQQGQGQAAPQGFPQKLWAEITEEDRQETIRLVSIGEPVKAIAAHLARELR